MSRFSNCLTQVIAESGRLQAEWAAKAGLSQSIVSRYCVGASRPDVKSMEKLCAGLADESAQKLLMAYIEDDLPENVRHLVQIRLTKGSVREDEPTPQEFNALDKKTKKAILFLTRIALKEPDAQAALQSTARYLGCKI